MGVSYKGGTSSYHSVSDNVFSVSKDYPINASGYFGTKGDSSDNSVRHITSEDPTSTAKDFYDKLAYGGIESNITNKKTGKVIGKKTTMKDGTIITSREVSSSDGSPAVDINIQKSNAPAGISGQKIHFVKEKEKWKA